MLSYTHRTEQQQQQKIYRISRRKKIVDKHKGRVPLQMCGLRAQKNTYTDVHRAAHINPHCYKVCERKNIVYVCGYTPEWEEKPCK